MSPMPRKDLSLHKLQNTRPEFVEPDVEIVPGRPRYPKSVSAAARKVFKRLCTLLERRRSLTEGDGEMLRLYAVLFDRHTRALAKIELEGEVCLYNRLDNQGKAVACEKPNLWLKIAQDSESKMISILDRLGLTPLNRAKVKPAEPPKDAKPVDPEDELLTRGRNTEPAPSISLDDIEIPGDIQ